MARALLPVKTTSAHWLAHPSFADAIERFLEREGSGIHNYMQELEQRHDQVKHQLQSLIADNEIAVFSMGAISWKRSKDSVSLDSKALTKAHPELLEQFGKTRPGSRRGSSAGTTR